MRIKLRNIFLENAIASFNFHPGYFAPITISLIFKILPSFRFIMYISVGEGNTVGEIALIKEDCVRTASVVVDEDTDLMVVDRTLYNRSVRDVLEKEFHDKTLFVETNPLFSSWSPKMKKSLAISLKREIHFYGSPIVRQGQPVEDLYIITE